MKNAAIILYLGLYFVLVSASIINAQVDVSPYGLSVAMGQGEVEEVVVLLSNRGDEDVIFDIDIDRVDLSSGVYLLELTAGADVSRRKLTLVK